VNLPEDIRKHKLTAEEIAAARAALAHFSDLLEEGRTIGEVVETLTASGMFDAFMGGVRRGLFSIMVSNLRSDS